LGATLAEDGSVATCGGFLVQALPKADNAIIDSIMERITKLPALSELIETGGAEEVIRELFGEIPYTILESHDIFFRCGCDLEKVERALLTLGSAELRDMQSQENGAEVSCEFCRKSYHLDATELDNLIVQASEQTKR
jgi:molecular chaperone Hsp33